MEKRGRFSQGRSIGQHTSARRRHDFLSSLVCSSTRPWEEQGSVCSLLCVLLYLGLVRLCLQLRVFVWKRKLRLRFGLPSTSARALQSGFFREKKKKKKRNENGIFRNSWSKPKPKQGNKQTKTKQLKAYGRMHWWISLNIRACFVKRVTVIIQFSNRALFLLLAP